MLTVNKQVTLAHVPESAERVIEQVKNGEVNPLAVDYFCKCMEEFTKLVRKNVDVKSAVLTEAEKYEGQVYNGAIPKIKTRQTAIFKDATLAELKQAVKDRQDLLKAITSNNRLVDPETGEELQPPEYKVTTYLEWQK